MWIGFPLYWLLVGALGRPNNSGAFLAGWLFNFLRNFHGPAVYVGVLSILLPWLEREYSERPEVIVGTSVALVALCWLMAFITGTGSNFGKMMCVPPASVI